MRMRSEIFDRLTTFFLILNLDSNFNNMAINVKRLF